MGTVSASAIYTALRNAGFGPSEALTMTAISYAESGWNTDAVYVTPNEYSVGAFQINLKAHPNVTEQCARDLQCSANAAYQIYLTQGFHAWSTYNTPRFWQGLALAQQQLAGVVSSSTSTTPAIPKGIDADTGPVAKTTSVASDIFGSVASIIVFDMPMFILGLALILIGALGIAMKSSTVRFAAREFIRSRGI